MDPLNLARTRAHTLRQLALTLAPLHTVPPTVDALLQTLGTLDGQPHGVLVVFDGARRVVSALHPFGPAAGAPKAEPVPDLRPPSLVMGAALDTAALWAEVARSGQAVFGPPVTWLPLPGRQQAPGLVALDFGLKYPIDDDEQTFLLSVTGLGGQALEETNRQLEERSLELQGFTRALAQNLSEPLQRIHGFLKLAEAALGEDLPPRTRRLFSLAHLEAETLAERSDELRMLAQVDGQPLRLETVDLRRLLAQVQHDLVPLTQGRNVAWTIGALPAVRGDALLLYQAFMELLAFALENTWQHPEPRVSIRAEVPDGQVLVYIQDNGAGVTATAQDHLFEVLDRSVARRTAFGRLGLSNVRRVVNRHGGWIRASTPPEGGLAFVLSLPRPVTDAASAPS
ncbi:hypothetical protein GCM10010840_28160 [Deinococcus aerolatus]|uniref:histidine kinase n=1 Tax=Deinococcus aerolatus TaxID=522487 RepID=A0ABQ2GDZ0_9DEIO|nr:HAMP domain-containing sensor histidine kinase [Deinococcus aerolatus]GGL88534.1 hypothetical protein GCM10010840_28160 [Deinococcus aerolatus]